MAKNENPIFTKAPVIGMAEVSVANLLLDGLGTIVSLIDGGVEGVRLDIFESRAIVTTTAGMLRLFLSSDSGGTWELWMEIPVVAIAPSSTLAAFAAEVIFNKPLNLPDSTWELGVSTNNAEAQNVFVRGGSLEK
jgi:hypothetical protein